MYPHMLWMHQALEIDWDKGTPSWLPRRVSPWEVRLSALAVPMCTQAKRDWAASIAHNSLKLGEDHMLSLCCWALSAALGRATTSLQHANPSPMHTRIPPSVYDFNDRNISQCD